MTSFWEDVVDAWVGSVVAVIRLIDHVTDEAIEVADSRLFKAFLDIGGGHLLLIGVLVALAQGD